MCVVVVIVGAAVMAAVAVSSVAAVPPVVVSSLLVRHTDCCRRGSRRPAACRPLPWEMVMCRLMSRPAATMSVQRIFGLPTAPIVCHDSPDDGQQPMASSRSVRRRHQHWPPSNRSISASSSSRRPYNKRPEASRKWKKRNGQHQQQVRRNALAEDTIGLVIAANLALTFVRDVRRERMAAKSGIVQQAPSRFSMTARPDAGSFRTVARPFVIHSAILSSRGRCNSNGMKNFSPLFRPV